MSRLLALIVLFHGSLCSAQDSPPRTLLSGQVELARLVDLCAERLDINIEYDATALRGTVTLRLGAGVTDDELWLLTNRVLASRGFASVRMPGEEMFSIVRAADAPGMARLEQGTDDRLNAGYQTIIVRIEHQPPRVTADALKLVLSKSGSAVTQIGETRMLLISDLAPRIDEAMRLLEQLDVPVDAPDVVRIPVEHIAASQIAPLVVATAAARDSLTLQPMTGTMMPVPDGSAVVLLAPPDEIDVWRALIAQFDAREAVETRSYSPRHFAVQEVSRLIQEAVQTAGPRGSGDQWKLVADELTGTLIVTATPTEHERIDSLLARLDLVPSEARRPMRAFSIGNRNVREIVDVVARLIDAGVLEDGELTPDGATSSESELDSSPPVSSGAGSSNRIARIASDSVLLTSDEGTNTLIATGDPRKLAQLEELIRRLDVRQPQVMVEVLVISLTESDALDLGVELQKLEISGSTLIRLSSLFGLGTGANLETLPTPGTGFTGAVLSPGDFSVVLRALQTISRGRTITLPKVLVNNNQQATLDSVLQQPFSTLVSIDQVTTTSLGGTLDAGTVVTITPQIAERDHLILEYSIALSSFVGESPDPLLPPPRQQNKLQSVVTIPDGYTVVVGGLELKSQSDGVSQVPLLGDLPLFGEAFKSRSKSSNRSRFYVFIRTNVLRHEGFEDLKYLSDRDAFDASAASIMRDFPTVVPRIIR